MRSSLLDSAYYDNIMRNLNQSDVLEDDDPELLELIVECNQLCVDIQNETATIHNFIRDRYRSKFPELDSIVHSPIDYARVVKKIGNDKDGLTLVDLEGLLPPHVVMVVCIAASATIGQPLPEDVFKTTIQACDCALELDQLHKKILDFFQTRVGSIAPNLSATVGSAVAAKLMGAVGGLSKLSIMPACSVLLLSGAKRDNMTGFSRKNTTSFLHETEIMHSTPPALWSRASRLVAAKSTLAARVDSIMGDPTGETGRLFLEEIRKKIDKWQERPHPRQVKYALPVPGSDNPKKKKRGGRRHRKWKEKYASTKLMKMANRMQFGIPEEEGYGMMFGLSKLGAEFTNKFEKKHYGSSSGTTTSGLTSSFAFSHAQSINLSNPQVHANQIISGTKSTYFSEVGTFSFVNRN